MTLGEYLVKLLENYGVDTVFGIPGVHTVDMYRGLAGSKIRHITPRHEQSAGFMADGYARACGKPGVALLITGPGLTNALTAMGQAYADSIPMLVISAVNHMGKIGHGEGELHESPNQSQMAAQVSASSFRVNVPADLPKAIARAFAQFEAARPRPVHIEIPVDLFGANADDLPLNRAANILPARPARAAMEQAITLCQNAKSPVIFLGGGCRKNAEIAVELAERLDAPTVMTINARGIIPAGHPLEISASPSLNAIRDLANNADLVLAFGTEMGRTDYNVFEREPFAVKAPLIRCDIDPIQMVRNTACDVALVGDAGEAMHDLLAGLKPSRNNGAARAATARKAALAEQPDKYQKLITLLETLQNTVPDAYIIGDSTQLSYAGNMYFPVNSTARWYNSACGFGALGYALPASIGAKVAAPNTPVICLAGDGGLQFTIAELGAAMEIAGPFIVICWNNNGYGEIKSAMQNRNVTPIGVDLHTPDFVMLAKSYGMEATHAVTLKHLKTALQKAIKSRIPTLIEITESDMLASMSKS